MKSGSKEDVFEKVEIEEEFKEIHVKEGRGSGIGLGPDRLSS